MDRSGLSTLDDATAEPRCGCAGRVKRRPRARLVVALAAAMRIREGTNVVADVVKVVLARTQLARVQMVIQRQSVLPELCFALGELDEQKAEGRPRRSC